MNFERGIEDPKKSLQIGEKHKAIHILRMKRYHGESDVKWQSMPSQTIHKVLRELQKGIYPECPYNLRYMHPHPKSDTRERQDIIGDEKERTFVFENKLYKIPGAAPPNSLRAVPGSQYVQHP